VQDLKAELLEKIVNPAAESGLARNYAARVAAFRASPRAASLRGSASAVLAEFSVAASPLSEMPAVQRSIALGITRHGRQYLLAVRVQRQALMNALLLKRIVETARGEVDVRLIGRIDKRISRIPASCPWYRGSVRPLLIGSSTAHFDVTAGTIGSFVRRHRRVFVLSNNHVLANEDRARSGDKILQPGPLDGGKVPQDAFGELGPWVRLNRKGGNRVDAALASVDGLENCDPGVLRQIVNGADRRLAGVAPGFPDIGTPVFKIGRTTGPTSGRVTAFEVDNIVANYDVAPMRFDDQIEIEGEGDKPFSDGGDSGALVVDSDMKALGLLFAGSETGGAAHLGLTYANRIQTVLTELKAELVC
jgi:hypothetical protein